MKRSDRKKLSTEKDIGVPVIQWLEEQGWEIFQEVQGPGGGVADIVGRLGSIVCVVELKMSLTTDVMAQAKRWLRYAHWVFVAVPHARDSDGRQLAMWICELLGIGVMTVSGPMTDGPEGLRVTIKKQPRLQRKIEKSLIDTLEPEHKTFAVAGGRHGRRWTPFQATCERIASYVRDNPGATVKQVLGSIEHHYNTDSTARTCLVHWGQKGSIRGVFVRRSGRVILFDPDPACTACVRCSFTIDLNPQRDHPELCENCRRVVAIPPFVPRQRK